MRERAFRPPDRENPPPAPPKSGHFLGRRELLTAQDFYKSVEQYLAVQDALRDKPELAALSHDIYGDIADGNRSELHMVIRMLQGMEIAWSQLRLDRWDDHALNLGWVDVLRRWANSAAVQRYWPQVRNEFSRGFQRYFERISTPQTEAHEKKTDATTDLQVGVPGSLATATTRRAPQEPAIVARPNEPEVR